ncbi:MAG: imidazole glycerol phosphate synthase subunit HisF [Saprospiraceae bacterium]|nr:imidazole glycerol phosphate synthase subunit HisF [Saprospiraceae bacterium]
MRTRVIPILLLHKGGLVKSVKFKNYQYIGDPINAVRVFNHKEVDELTLIDIDATREGRSPHIKEITDIVSEAFMPVSYGGGITTLDEIKSLLFNGVEKIILNKQAYHNPALITKAASRFGSQSVVVSIDVKKNFFGLKKIYINNGSKPVELDLVAYAKRLEEAGAGELLINSIDRDGTYMGYDLALLETITKAVGIPVIACGGASCVEDMIKAKKSGASALAAGSMFVFQRPHNAVLISYLNALQIKEINNV